MSDVDVLEEDYDYVSISDCEVRFIEPIDEEDIGELELWWRILWSTNTTTLEPESVFEERHEDIVDYVSRHSRAIKNKIAAAMRKYPEITKVHSSYYPMDGNDNEVLLPTAVIRVTGEDAEGDGDEMEAQVTTDGEMLLTRKELAEYFGYEDDECLMMGIGKYIATHNNRRFVVDTSIVSAGVTLKLWGTRMKGRAKKKDAENMAEEIWSKPTWLDELSHGTTHLDAVFKWLKYRKLDSSDAVGKDFVHNTRRRYEIRKGILYYKRGRRQAKNLPKRIERQRVPNVEIPRQDRAWALVEADHKLHHDGHNRTEQRLGALYMIPGIRDMCKHARQCCNLCDSFVHATKEVVTPIITSRPMQLLMFDLFFLPFKDEGGNGICMMIIDHFTKYKWGAIMTQKSMHEVAPILIKVIRTEGNCERWHCDNGSEFINYIVEQARLLLGVGSITTGRPRHPQCQGLVERANGTCKRKILMKCAEEGLQNGDSLWNWEKHLEEVLMQENDAPLKLYKGLSAFFCLRLRPRDIVEMNAIRPEDIAKIHPFMHECQINQGKNVAGTAVIEVFEVDDQVKVRAGYQEVKKRTVVGTWTTEATVHEVHSTTANYYKLRWITRGLNKETPGSVSKRWYPWTALRIKAREGDQNMMESSDTEAEEGAEEDEVEEKVMPRSTKMIDSPKVMAEILEEVGRGKRGAWDNQRGSCHVDTFLMLEIAAIIAAPWRLQDDGMRRNGK